MKKRTLTRARNIWPHLWGEVAVGRTMWRIVFEPRDLWLGVYWDKEQHETHAGAAYNAHKFN